MHTGRPTSGPFTLLQTELQSSVCHLGDLNNLIVAPALSLEIKNQKAVSSLTRGLVGDSSFAILPEITSGMTFIITLISQLVCQCCAGLRRSYQYVRWYGGQLTACF